MLPLTPLPPSPTLVSGCARGEALVSTPVPVGGGVCAPPPAPCPWEGIPEGLCLAAPSGNTWELTPGPTGGTRGDISTGRFLS